jgi:hypothetical protein
LQAGSLCEGLKTIQLSNHKTIQVTDVSPTKDEYTECWCKTRSIKHRPGSGEHNMSTQEVIKKLSLEAGFASQVIAMLAVILRPASRSKKKASTSNSMECQTVDEFERRKATESLNIITANMRR